MKTACLIVVSFWFGLLAQEEVPTSPPVPPDQEAFALAELVQDMRETGRGWTSFLERADLSCGLYRIAAGARDGQGPHPFDEVYYVAEGKAILDAGNESFSCEPGSILYVKKDVEHRFRDIEEDLTVLVFFAKGGPASTSREAEAGGD